jgi:uncharacterized protein involved in exopolysaccharide biosynthesis
MTKKISLKKSNLDDADIGSMIDNRTESSKGEILSINLFELTGIVLKRKRMITAAMIAVMLLTAVVLFLTPNQYISSAKILPSGKPDKLAVLQDLTGLGGSNQNDENSSELYPIILKSRSIGTAISDKEFSFIHGSKEISMTLEEYFKTKSQDALLVKLNKITSVGMDKKTGVIDIRVETKYPAFSQELLSTYIGELENFNIHKRKSQAKEAAIYLEKQLNDVENGLKATEDKMQNFLDVNRGWATTTNPELLKILKRFERDIEIKSAIYLNLSQEYEIAKLNAQKDIPIVRILDHPSLPNVKSGPKRISTILISGIATFIAMCLMIFIHHSLQRASAGPDRRSYESLREDFQRQFPKVNRILKKREKKDLINV